MIRKTLVNEKYVGDILFLLKVNLLSCFEMTCV